MKKIIPLIPYMLFTLVIISCIIFITYIVRPNGLTAQENYRQQQKEHYQIMREYKHSCQTNGGLFTLRQKIGEDGLPVVVTWDCKSF